VVVLLIHLYWKPRGVGRLPGAYWHALREHISLLFSIKLEKVRRNQQPGYAMLQDMSLDETRLQVLEDRQAAVRKALYWIQVEDSRDRYFLDYEDDYIRFLKASEEFERDSTAPFPEIPNYDCGTNPKFNCLKTEGINCCLHDVDKILRGNRNFSKEFLVDESRKWNPGQWGARGDEIQAQALQLYNMLLVILEGRLGGWI
jgi:hypothetical protein